MTGGDARRYPCSRCGDRLLLTELLAHVESHVRPARGGTSR